MSCPICRYETGDGKYCKKCGARLIIEDSPVFAAMKEQAAASEVYGVARQGGSINREIPHVRQGEAALPVYTPPDISFPTAAASRAKRKRGRILIGPA